MTSSTQTGSTSTACNRFFSVDELVTLFLENAPTLVLINCQRVCRKWNEIIQDSPLLQQHLFLSATDQDEFVLNPILWQCFGPILGTEELPHHSKRQTTYSDLSLLPWAREGKTLDSPSRLAFSREEASWRDMYISQPPIYRLDWWHSWSVFSPPSDEDDNWGRSGWGHQDLPDQSITLGVLWDLLESRLYRGCVARISYFPDGMHPKNDETAIAREVEWAEDWDRSQLRGFTAEMPRVKLSTYQVWRAKPAENQNFNLEAAEWEVNDGSYSRHDYVGDGFNVLRHDCNHDHGWNGEACRRWSRSEGFAYAEIHGESSGSS